MDERANPLDQPDKLGRQSKPQQSKPRRFSFLRDKGQACGHLNAGVIRSMLSLGVSISFVQKINASSTFRSIRANFLGKEFNLDPTMYRTVSGKQSGNQHASRTLKIVGHTMGTVWQSQQSGRQRLRPGEIGILRRDENPVRTDRQRAHHFRPRNTRRGRCHRA